MEATIDVNESSIMKVCDWVYDSVVNKIPQSTKIIDSAEDLAKEYSAKAGFLSEKVDSLINWQCVRSGAIGFTTNLGGLATIPFALPAEFTSVLFVQIRMIAAIAKMGGYDLKSDKVKTLVLCSLVGDSVISTVKTAGIKIVEKTAHKLIEKIPNELIKEINRIVGYRLITKFGEKGIINLGKLIPVASGLTGATFDVLSTVAIGKVAKACFIEKDESYIEKQNNLKNLIKRTAQNTQL